MYLVNSYGEEPERLKYGKEQNSVGAIAARREGKECHGRYQENRGDQDPDRKLTGVPSAVRVRPARHRANADGSAARRRAERGVKLQVAHTK